MYLALCVEYGRDDQLIFAQQLGVEHVVMAVECWDAASLAHAKNRVEQATLTLAGLEGLSLQDAEAAQTALRATGANGIGLVAAARPPAGDRAPVGRGGALVGMPVRASSDPPGLARILAAADAANVRLALGADVAGVGVDLDLAITREAPSKRPRALLRPAYPPFDHARGRYRRVRRAAPDRAGGQCRRRSSSLSQRRGSRSAAGPARIAAGWVCRAAVRWAAARFSR